MNFLLHSQKCPGHIIPLPHGVPELMADISREVLREQPSNIPLFIADFLDAMLLTRESVKIAQATINDVTDYAVEIVTFYVTTCMPPSKAKHVVSVFQRYFKETIDDLESYCDDAARFDETRLMQKLIQECDLNMDEAQKALHIIRNAYKKYYYRQTRYEAQLLGDEAEWQDKVKNTLYIYAKAKPSQAEMNRAAVCLQAAYRGYCTRKKSNELKHKAATKIQATFRGYLVRKSVRLNLHPKAIGFSRKEAAILIQKTFRGYLARKQLNKIKTKKHFGSSTSHINKFKESMQQITRQIVEESLESLSISSKATSKINKSSKPVKKKSAIEIKAPENLDELLIVQPIELSRRPSKISMLSKKSSLQSIRSDSSMKSKKSLK